ncbi:hypothetical protein TorRG33x02_299390, partial [Trema orientale]
VNHFSPNNSYPIQIPKANPSGVQHELNHIRSRTVALPHQQCRSGACCRGCDASYLDLPIDLASLTFSTTFLVFAFIIIHIYFKV